MKPLDHVCLNGADALNFSAKIVDKSDFDDILSRLIKFAISVPEFRRTSGNYRHKLRDILILEIMARLSKCVRRAEIIRFGKQYHKRFLSMGLFQKGIPSEATFFRVSNSVDEETMAASMAEFTSGFRREAAEKQGQEIICIDGKATRGTTGPNGRNPDIVSAYSYTTGLTLATEMCDLKSNEITAGPRLLDKVDIRGCIITADAMFFQKQIIDKIREKGADFVIELKANQRSLRYGLEDKLKTAKPDDVYIGEPDLSHGRITTRRCRVFNGEDLIEDKAKWGGRLTVVEICTEIINKRSGVRTAETRIYVSSLSCDVRLLNEITRLHWSIECEHWSLDCNLHQDAIKRKTPRAARNLDTLQRIVLNILSAWRNRRKKLADKRMGTAQLLRHIAASFTNLLRFLKQK